MSDSVYDSDYGRMMRGEHVPGCTCVVVREMRGWESYNGPEPAEWEQNPDCPLHGFELRDRDELEAGQ